MREPRGISAKNPEKYCEERLRAGHLLCDGWPSHDAPSVFLSPQALPHQPHRLIQRPQHSVPGAAQLFIATAIRVTAEGVVRIPIHLNDEGSSTFPAPGDFEWVAEVWGGAEGERPSRYCSLRCAPP